MFDGIVIAANEGHHDLGALAQQLLQELAGTDCTIACFEAHPRLFFRADTTEELIQIVYDSHLITPQVMRHRFELFERIERLEPKATCLFKSFKSFQPFNPYRIPLH